MKPLHHQIKMSLARGVHRTASEVNKSIPGSGYTLSSVQSSLTCLYKNSDVSRRRFGNKGPWVYWIDISNIEPVIEYRYKHRPYAFWASVIILPALAGLFSGLMS